MRRYLAEAIGTFMMVFCGTGAIVINDISNGIIGHAGIAITFGLIVMGMIYAFGSISGAHINPAVSIAFIFTGSLEKKQLIPYIISQLLGAFAASLLLKLLFASHLTLGSTLPQGSEFQSLVLEIVLTYILMLVILLVSGNKEVDRLTGVVVGGIVLLEAMFAGPICGASMNPARSIAPALISGNIDSLWLYIIAPISGALLATFTWKAMKVG